MGNYELGGIFVLWGSYPSAALSQQRHPNRSISGLRPPPHKTPNKSKLFIGVSETRGDRKMKRGDVIKIELNDAKQTDDAVEGWPI